MNQTAINIARAYGSLARAIAERQNAERSRVAQANFDATRNQINAQKAEKAAELSRVFRKHTASIRANAAYRGIGGGTVAALEGSASAEAEILRRNIEINANNAIGAAAAEANIPMEDPLLSQLEGTFQGLRLGMEFVNALALLPSQTVRNSTWVQTGAGWQQWYNYSQQPQYVNFTNLFPELNTFLNGGA